MPYLPVDTAVVVEVGPLIDDTDFKSLKGTIAYDASGMDIDLLKKSVNALVKVDVTLSSGGTSDWTHKGKGVYELEITAAQNDTLGSLRAVGLVDDVLPFESPVYTVVPQMVYNALVAGSDKLQVDVCQVGGTAVPETSGKLHVLDDAGDTVANEANQITIAEYLDTEIATIDGVVDDILLQVDVNYDEIGDNAVDISTLSATLLRYVMLIVRKDAAIKADAADDLTAINTNLGSGGGSYDNETESQEAIQAKLTDIDTKTTNLPTDPADASVIAAALATIAAYIDTEVQAIKDKTDNLPGSPAAVGSEMTLENDAIKAAKYDESTAFPVKKTDSGDTEIARTGADGDTLEDISDEIAAIVAGGGSETWVFTLTEAGSDEPVADANVWVTADEAGEGTVIVSGFTDTLGKVTFYLDTGTYYFWAEKSGWNFSNPYLQEVS